MTQAQLQENSQSTSLENEPGIRVGRDYFTFTDHKVVGFNTWSPHLFLLYWRCFSRPCTPELKTVDFVSREVYNSLFTLRDNHDFSMGYPAGVGF